MLKWQRLARWLIAILGVSFAVLVASTLGSRTNQVAQTPREGKDPKAVAESGTGLTFRVNGNKEELRIVDETHVSVVPDENGKGAMSVTSGAMEFRRNEKLLRFDRAMKASRTEHQLAAEAATAHLSQDEQRLESLELRAGSSITAQQPKS